MSATASSYTEGGVTYDYGVVPAGQSNNDLFVTAFDIDIGNGLQTFAITNFADGINIMRQDNSNVGAAFGTAEKQLLFFEAAGTSTNPIELRPGLEDLMEDALLNQVINRGTDNVFANSGGANLNNIERIDYIETSGLTVPADSIGEGFIVLDRGGNDDFLIAAITSLDGSGNPDQWGPVVTVDSTTDWGLSSFSIETDALASDSPADNLVRTADLTAQPISGVFISYADLGAATNDVIYGYSLAGADSNKDPVAAEWSDVSDATRFPRDTTSASSAAGGLDLIAGGSVVSRTPKADLAVTLAVNDATPTVGDNVTFTITAINNGPFTTTDTIVDDLLPSGYTYVSHTAATGTYDQTTGVWDIGSKAINDPKTLEITATVNATGVYTNAAEISSVIASDPDSTNNTAEQSVTPTQLPSDLTITKSSNVSGSVNHGDTITYTIEVENTGASTVSNVDVTDTLPAGVTYVSGSIAASLNPPGTDPSTVVNTITASGSGTFTVPADVTELQVEAWAGGGSGASSTTNDSGGAGGGGAYSRLNALTVSPGDTINYSVGAGGALPGAGNPGNPGGDSWFVDNTTLLAEGGRAGGAGSIEIGGAGGSNTNSIGDLSYSGGAGGSGATTGKPTDRAGGGGGGSAFSTGNGGPGTDGDSGILGTGGNGEGNGGDGGQAGTISAQGGLPPGGGGGGCGGAGAGAGADGQLVITYTIPGTNGTTSAPSGTIASGWTLEPGAILTVTFDVTVDTDAVVTELTNATTFTSDDDPSPIGDSVTDSVNGATLESFVWDDLDGDGIQDAGEPGLKNATINLLDGTGSAVLDTQGSPITGTTDSAGNVSFPGLPPGSYMLEFDPAGLPAGYTLTIEDADSQGAAGSVNSDADPTTGRTPSVTLTTGQTYLTLDAGAYAPPSIQGKVLGDTTGDGSGDTPQTGVTVELLDASGTTILQTTTTDADGKYSFTNLTPGSYQVRQTPPAGFTAINDVDGGDRTIIGDQTLITVESGDNLANQTFINLDDTVASATISGVIEIDTTNDGIGDTPQQGIDVQLQDDLGDPLQNTVTAADGSYSFTVTPGDYQVVQTVPTGFEAINDVDGGDLTINGDQSTITVNTNDTITGQDFANSQYGVVTAPEFCLGLNATLDGDFVRTEGLPSNVTYYLESAAALDAPTTWSGSVLLDSGNTTATSNGDGTETVTITDIPTLTALTSGAGFVRLSIELDADSDTVADETTYSFVSGWLESDFGVECRSYNNPFLSCPPLRANVTGVSGSDLTLDDDADGLTAGVDYYIEVLDGTYEGHRFDVASTSGTTLTISTTTDLCSFAAPFNTMTGAPDANLVGSSIVVRAHKTLNSLFPVGQFDATNDPATADLVTIYDGSANVCYWLYDNSGSPYWVLSGDAGLADQGGVVVPPGYGVWVNSNSSKTLTSYGQVRGNDFIRPLCQGLNYVTGGYPITQSAVDREYSTANGFTGNVDYVMADQFLIWNGDSTAGQLGYQTYYLSDYYSPERWIKAADIFRVDVKADPLFIRDHAVILDLQSDIPNYTNQTPWSAN